MEAGGLHATEESLRALAASVPVIDAPLGLDPVTEEHVPPAARHAWVQAVLTLHALERGVPLAVVLADLGGLAAAPSVPVNAVLPLASEEETVRAAKEAVARGFTCLKLKVEAAPREVRRVAAVRATVGNQVGLRIDANGSWTEELAREMLRRLEPFSLEYVEQPLPPARLSDLLALRKQTHIPFAADESARVLPQALALIEKRAVDVVVVKPMALGGVDHALTLVRAGLEHGVKVVVTDSAESAVGRAAALHVAALLPHPAPACGLGSGDWLSRDIVAHPTRVDAGRMVVPTTPGLGLDGPQLPTEAR